jgi:hypothetical protein
MAVEEEAVELRWPASRRALELILSLGGLLVGLAAGGELCWEGATVTNVTADCLHGTAVAVGKGSFDRVINLWAGQSRNNDCGMSMQMAPI